MKAKVSRTVVNPQAAEGLPGTRTMDSRSDIFTLIFWALLALGLGAPILVAAENPEPSPQYDPDLAQRLGADDYGMRSYVLVILTTGPAEISDPERRKTLFAGHFSNMARMAEAGQLLLAGPLMDAPPKRGLFVLNVDNLEEAEALVRTDPAVAAGIFDFELAKWYGSAGVMMVKEIHQQVQAKAIE